jgi:hypothetical protein
MWSPRIEFNPFRVDEFADRYPSVATRRRNAGLIDGIPVGFRIGNQKMWLMPREDWRTPRRCRALYCLSSFQLLGWLAASAYCETLTLPLDKRPEWLQRDGIVMAGSWEPLIHRVRRDGSKGYEATPEQRAAYEREHSPEMVAELKALGINFVMMHAYKGYGLEAERESMADAVHFSKLCHEGGLHVGVYNYSGAFGWELFFRERADAREWLLTDQSAKPITYGSSQYRYYWNRNHPAARAFYQDIVRFAVRDIQADLIHFDNYGYGPGFDTCSVERFRQYLRQTFTARELKAAGIRDLETVYPPMDSEPNDLRRRAWKDFTCQSLADSYSDMTRYARRLRKDILLECNPPPPGDHIRPPVDHGRILPGGEAFWEEGPEPGYRNGVLHSRIRTYKIGRSFENSVFAYTRNPIEAAEAMAFNRDCLGCVCWFEYGKIVRMPGAKEPMSTNLLPFIRFFNTNRDLFCNTTAVADVAVLRSFPSQVFADNKWRKLTDRVEKALIENCVPFQTIHDSQLTNLRHYRAIVLAGCVALSDHQIKLLKRFVADGGKLCVIGPAATHDEWLRPRAKPGLGDTLTERLASTLAPPSGGARLPTSCVAYYSESDDCIAAVRQSCGGQFSLNVTAPASLCAELTEQGGRQLVHLVNYRENQPATNVTVNLVLPPGNTAKTVRLTSPEREASTDLTFEQRADAVTFTVPHVNTYEIAVVETR